MNALVYLRGLFSSFFDVAIELHRREVERLLRLYLNFFFFLLLLPWKFFVILYSACLIMTTTGAFPSARAAQPQRLFGGPLPGQRAPVFGRPDGGRLRPSLLCGVRLTGVLCALHPPQPVKALIVQCWQVHSH